MDEKKISQGITLQICAWEIPRKVLFSETFLYWFKCTNYSLYDIKSSIFRKRGKKSYIVWHKDRLRFFCRLKHILPVVHFPFPVKFLIRPLGVGLQLPAPLHQLPVWYVHQFGWLLLIFFSMNFSDSPDSKPIFFNPFGNNIRTSTLHTAD